MIPTSRFGPAQWSFAMAKTMIATAHQMTGSRPWITMRTQTAMALATRAQRRLQPAAASPDRWPTIVTATTGRARSLRVQRSWLATALTRTVTVVSSAMSTPMMMPSAAAIRFRCRTTLTAPMPVRLLRASRSVTAMTTLPPSRRLRLNCRPTVWTRTVTAARPALRMPMATATDRTRLRWSRPITSAAPMPARRRLRPPSVTATTWMLRRIQVKPSVAMASTTTATGAQTKMS